MPWSAPRPCTQPGCRELISRQRPCPHGHGVQQDKRERDRYRPNAHQRGYDHRWRKASKSFLAVHPLCECDECRTRQRVRPASVVDHVIPHRNNPELFWDQSNWRAMAKACHDRKTATEDGGFGNEKRERRK